MLASICFSGCAKLQTGGFKAPARRARTAEGFHVRGSHSESDLAPLRCRSVQLPPRNALFAGAANAEPASLVPSVGGTRRPQRIPVVKDHANTAAILARLLRRMGHDVIRTGSVREALQLTEKEMQIAPIDLVMSDLGLPASISYPSFPPITACAGLP